MKGRKLTGKRILLFVLAALVLLSVCGCGKQEDGRNPGGSDSGTGAAAETVSDPGTASGTVAMETVSDPETVSGTESVSKSEAETEPSTSPASETGTEAGTESESKPVYEATEVTLYQEGNRIISGNGEEVRLAGVNIPQFCWNYYGDGDMSNPDAFVLLESALNDWDCNIIRVPLKAEFWLENKGNYIPTVQRFVDLIAEAGKYALLEDHSFYVPEEKDYEFWESVAVEYANHPNVLFGVFNEPVCDWQQWYDTVPKLVETIRKTGADNLVSVGGVDWAYDPTKMFDNELLTDAQGDGNGLLVEIHPYYKKPGYRDSYWKKIEPLAAEYPFLVGEMGIESFKYTVTPEEEKEYLDLITGYIDQYEMHLTAWAMGADPFLTKTCNPVTLTAYGEYMREYILGIRGAVRKE